MVNDDILKIAHRYTFNGKRDQTEVPLNLDVQYLARAVIDLEKSKLRLEHEVASVERSLCSRIDQAAMGAMLGILAKVGCDLPASMVVERAYDYAEELARVAKERARAAVEREEAAREAVDRSL